jgi:tetratricopeptide (TPR) repeat protein
MTPLSDPAEAATEAKELSNVVAKNPNDVAATIMWIRLLDLADDTAALNKASEQALAKHANNRELLEVIAMAARDADQAERFWGALIAAHPTVTKYPLQLGRDLISFEARTKAREVLTPLTKHEDRTTKAEAFYQLARLELAEQQPERARNAFTEATRADENSTSDYDGIVLSGQIDEAAGQLRLAANSYQRAIDTDNKRPETWRLLARCLVRDNRKTEARTTLRQWFVLCPNTTAEDRALAADLYLQLESDAEAYDLAKQALKGEQASVAQRVIGIVAARRGKWSEALEALAQVQPADNNAATFRAWMNAVIQTGELSKLASGPGKQLSTIPSTSETINLLKLLTRAQRIRATIPKEKGTAADRYVCAEMLYQQGQTADAERVLRQALTDFPELGQAVALRGLLHLERGRLSKALPDAETAIKQAPEEALGYLVRGRIRLERGTDGAINDLRKAVELSQKSDGRMLYWLAYAFAHDGRKTDARPLAEAAKKLLPNDADVQELLNELP